MLCLLLPFVCLRKSIIVLQSYIIRHFFCSNLAYNNLSGEIQQYLLRVAQYKYVISAPKQIMKQISCVLLYNRLGNCKIVFPAIQVTIWIVANIYFHVKEAAQGQVLYWQTGKPYWTLNFEGDCKCIFSQAKYLIIIHSGGSKNSKLKVVLGSIAGAVTLLVIGVLIVLWWQRMHYRPEIFIDVSGLSRSISG